MFHRHSHTIMLKLTLHNILLDNDSLKYSLFITDFKFRWLLVLLSLPYYNGIDGEVLNKIIYLCMYIILSTIRYNITNNFQWSKSITDEEAKLRDDAKYLVINIIMIYDTNNPVTARDWRRRPSNSCEIY